MLSTIFKRRQVLAYTLFYLPLIVTYWLIATDSKYIELLNVQLKNSFLHMICGLYETRASLLTGDSTENGSSFLLLSLKMKWQKHPQIRGVTCLKRKM